MGPSKRKEQLLNAFIEYDPEVSLDFMDRVYGPAGLHLAAETPAEIALSILSEILVVQRGTTAIHLQDKKRRDSQPEATTESSTQMKTTAVLILAAGCVETDGNCQTVVTL